LAQHGVRRHYKFVSGLNLHTTAALTTTFPSASSHEGSNKLSGKPFVFILENFCTPHAVGIGVLRAAGRRPAGASCLPNYIPVYYLATWGRSGSVMVLWSFTHLLIFWIATIYGVPDFQG